MIAVPWSIVAIVAIIAAVTIVTIVTAGRLLDTLLWTRGPFEPEYMRRPPGAPKPSARALRGLGLFR